MWGGKPSTSIAWATCGCCLPAAERPNQIRWQRPLWSKGIRGPKKDAGPKGPASQTGRLHVWETWDHEDPEFRTRKAKNRSCRKPALKIVFALHMGRGEFPATGMRWTHAFRRLCNPADLIFRIVSLRPSAKGNRGTRRFAWNAAIPQDR